MQSRAHGPTVRACRLMLRECSTGAPRSWYSWHKCAIRYSREGKPRQKVRTLIDVASERICLRAVAPARPLAPFSAVDRSWQQRQGERSLSRLVPVPSALRGKLRAPCPCMQQPGQAVEPSWKVTSS